MPQYFFHVFQDGHVSIDDEGTALADEAAAGIEAAQAMAELASDTIPGPGSSHLKMTVRDEAGAHLFELELRFTFLDLTDGATVSGSVDLAGKRTR